MTPLAKRIMSLLSLSRRQSACHHTSTPLKKVKTSHIQLFIPQVRSICKTHLPSIRSLTSYPKYGQRLLITLLTSNNARPVGWVARPGFAKAVAYLLVKGCVDIEAEISKAKTRLANASELLEKQRKTIEGVAKRGKTIEDVAEREMTTLEDARKIGSVVEGSMSQFERFKLE